MMDLSKPATPAHPRPRKVAGLTWTKGPARGSNEERGWHAVHGLYRFAIAGRAGGLMCYAYHLDPEHKTIDPSVERLYQDCLLNDVHPHGRTLPAIMEDVVRWMDYHEQLFGHMFHEARNITGTELKVGMWVHHKGVFYQVARLVPKEAPYTGWSVDLSDRDCPLWFLPSSKLTVWEEPTTPKES